MSLQVFIGEPERDARQYEHFEDQHPAHPGRRWDWLRQSSHKSIEGIALVRSLDIHRDLRRSGNSKNPCTQKYLPDRTFVDLFRRSIILVAVACRKYTPLIGESEPLSCSTRRYMHYPPCPSAVVVTFGRGCVSKMGRLSEMILTIAIAMTDTKASSRSHSMALAPV